VAVRVFYDPHRVEQLRQKGIDSRRQLTGEASTPEARSALDLVEDNARLRAEVARLQRDNQRLADENARLASASRQSGLSPPREERGSAPRDLDDAARRFALLELDL
jgi:hypothetical protein